MRSRQMRLEDGTQQPPRPPELSTRDDDERDVTGCASPSPALSTPAAQVQRASPPPGIPEATWEKTPVPCQFGPWVKTQQHGSQSLARPTHAAGGGPQRSLIALSPWESRGSSPRRTLPTPQGITSSTLGRAGASKRELANYARELGRFWETGLGSEYHARGEGREGRRGEGRRGEGRKWRLGSGGYWDGIKSRNSEPYRILPGGEGRERGERDPSSGLGSRREHTSPAWVPDERISDWQGQHPRANVQPRRERKAVVVFARRGSAQPRHHGDSRQASRFGLGGEGRRAGWIRYPPGGHRGNGLFGLFLPF
ncbi:unnamed protein product [Diplocarpon coronariae]